MKLIISTSLNMWDQAGVNSSDDTPCMYCSMNASKNRMVEKKGKEKVWGFMRILEVVLLWVRW